MPSLRSGPGVERQLLEREPQLAQLQAHLDIAQQSAGRMVLVGGSAGIGKTALVTEFCRRAGGRARVLIGACDSLATRTPLGPLFDIAATLGARGSRLTSASTSHQERFQAFLDLLCDPRAPCLVIFEDVHWADEATLDLLRFIGRRIGRSQSLFIVTYRNDEVGAAHPLRVVLGDLATLGTSHRISMPTLSLTAVRKLAADTRLDPDALYRLTGGNPFFVTEVLATGGMDIPPTVRDAVLARAARLSTAGRTTLDAAAVIGSPAELPLLDMVLAPDMTALDECVAAGMLVTSAHTYQFRHEIARQAILTTLEPQRRARLHQRTLTALESGAPDPSRLARLAHHAEACGRWQAVLRYAPEAARTAAQLGAHREAAAQFQRALHFAERLEPDQHALFLEQYAYECYLTDQLQAAIAARRAALVIWRKRGATLKEGENLYCMARILVLAGRNAEAEEASQSAITVLESEPPSPELAAAYQIQAHLRMLNRDNEAAIEQGLKAIGLATHTGANDALIYAHNTVGSAMLLANKPDGRRFLERSVAMARDAELDDYVASGLGNLGTASGEIHLFEQADRYLSEGIAYCAARDLDFDRHYMSAWLAISHMHQGRWSAASKVASDLLRLPELAAISEIMALVALGRVRARRGDPQVSEVLDRALAIATETATLQRLGPVHAARAEAAWLRGDLQQVHLEASAAFELARAHGHAWFVGEFAYWEWKSTGSQRVPAGAARPYALQVRGKWEAAAALWAELNCPYERARALAESSELEALERAFAIFDALGAGPAAAAAAQRLRELGAGTVPRGVRRVTRANPAGLTRRQMEVAVLIANGLTNAEIAGQLYISPKTVEHHVTAVFRKLKVTKRAEAIAAFERLDDSTPK